MKVPHTPPSEDADVLARLIAAGTLYASFEDALSAPYEHWEQFRFRKPTPPLTAAQAWTITKSARIFASRPLPFQAAAPRTFRFHYIDIAAVQRALHEIDSRARGTVGVDRSGATPGDRDVYLQRSLIEEPFSSSVLEGAATTREIAKRMIEEGRRPKTVGERMVLNNYRAMGFIREHRHEALTPGRVLEVHRILTEGTFDKPEKSGVLRDAADDVRVVDEQTNETLHQPPPAEELPARLERLCDFANETGDKNKFLHPVLRAIVLHFMLAYDHPFWDGNGRCARALFYWCVLKHEYWLLEYISISAVIRRAPIKYGAAFLHTETDGGDLTYFIIHQLEVIQAAITELDAHIQRKGKELQRIEQALAGLKPGYNRRQLQLIHDLIKHPKTTYEIAAHQKMHGVSYLTARSDLEGLAKDGILRKSKAGVKSVFTVGKNFTDIAPPLSR